MSKCTRVVPNVDENVVVNPVNDKFTQDLIRRKGWQLVARDDFTTSDREDIEQELWMKVLKAAPSFDRNRGYWNAFVTVVIDRRVASLIRDKYAGKRDYRRVRSLNFSIGGEDGTVELGETIGIREYNARRGCWPRERDELEQLKQDVAAIIPTLQPDDRELCENLMKHSVSETARRMHVSRSTVHRALRRLRRRFERAGLHEYLR